MFHKKIHSETKDIILNWNLISEWILTKCVEVASCETIILVCHVAVGSRRLLTSKFSTNWGLSSLLLAKTGISAKACNKPSQRGACVHGTHGTIEELTKQVGFSKP